MGKAQVAFNERPSTPALNIIGHKASDHIYSRFAARHSAFHHALADAKGRGASTIKFCKEKLGRQDFCFTTYRRYYVWEKCIGYLLLWRIFVHEEAGVSIEVDECADVHRINAAFDNLEKALGISDGVKKHAKRLLAT